MINLQNQMLKRECHIYKLTCFKGQLPKLLNSMHTGTIMPCDSILHLCKLNLTQTSIHATTLQMLGDVNINK